MIKDNDVAKGISDLMIEYQGKLAESVATVRDNCDEDEVYDYRKAIGEVLGLMIMKVMNPIFEEHPDLIPKEPRDK